MNSHRHIPQLAAACGLAVLAMTVLAGTVAACGSSSPSASGSSTPAATSAPATSAPATSSAPASATAGTGSTAAIITNWEAFFNAKTPDSKRIALLQDGPEFASVIKSQSGSGLAALATAKVTHVTVSSPTQATVTYEILVSGTPELKNQTGTAVLEDGTWKVGVASFCGLLTLENAGKTSGLPAACKSAA
jgi:hypothetical protein